MMAIFHMQERQTQDCVKLVELLNYIRDPLATTLPLIYGTYISCRYPYEEMMLVKQCYASALARTWQGRQFYEYIVSLPEEESMLVEQFAVCMVAINHFIATYGGGNYQTIHAIHVNTDNLHAHVVVNNIDIFTGVRFDRNRRACYELRAGVDAILQEYGFAGVCKKEIAA